MKVASPFPPTIAIAVTETTAGLDAWRQRVGNTYVGMQGNAEFFTLVSTLNPPARLASALHGRQ